MLTSLQTNIKDIIDKRLLDLHLNYNVICSNRLDIEYEVQHAVAKIGLFILINTPNLTYAGKDANGNLFYNIENLTINVIEIPLLNRKNKLARTSFDIAVLIADLLMRTNNYLVNRIDEVVEDNAINTTISLTCNFKANFK